MKLFVLFLATAAIASASTFGARKVHFTEDGTIVIQDGNGKQVKIWKNGPHGQSNIEIDVTGPNTLAKRIKIDNNNLVSIEGGVEYNIPINNEDNLDKRSKRSSIDNDSFQTLLDNVQKAVLDGYIGANELGVLNSLDGESSLKRIIPGQNYYGANMNLLKTQQKYYPEVFGNGQDINNILLKIFDKGVLSTILEQQQMLVQGFYGSKSMMWNLILSQQGIFDHQVLVKIINDKVLRNHFAAQGFFNKVVLDQIIYGYHTEGVYNLNLLQRLVNTHVLKNFFINQGISVFDILGQTTYKTGNTFNKKGLYSNNMLEKIISQPICRNILVQYGIFNKNILDQILFNLHSQGVYDQVLLKQLVNKEALYKALIRYGSLNQTVLREYVNNEKLGLTFLYNNNFFQYTPIMAYKQLAGFGMWPEPRQNLQVRVNPIGGNDLWNIM